MLEAMARGEQLVLIRKGGLIEPGTGFTLRAKTFLFYPTFEHQAVQYLREPFRGYFDDASTHRAPNGQVRFEFVGMAVSSAQSHDPDIVERLRDAHIYNPAFVSQRLKWQPEQPLTIVMVRTFRLTSPQVLPVAPHYIGCKSWVDLQTALPLDVACPVLEEAVFQQRAEALTKLLV